VAASTTEAEYMAASAAVREGLWLRRLLRELDVDVKAVPMRGDNKAALALIHSNQISGRSKHIDVVHHFVRDRVTRGEASFSYCSTSEQVADVLTKSLPVASFRVCCSGMGCK
jgi:hypothetical protein